jgi:hypothetical protein
MLTTLLFTDVVGSTDQVAAIGDRAWHTVLDRHDEAVRRHLGRFSGHQEKLTGDGILAAFEAPPAPSAAGPRSATPHARSASTFGSGSTPVKSNDAAPSSPASSDLRSESQQQPAATELPRDLVVDQSIGAREQGFPYVRVHSPDVTRRQQQTLREQHGPRNLAPETEGEQVLPGDPFHGDRLTGSRPRPADRPRRALTPRRSCRRTARPAGGSS